MQKKDLSLLWMFVLRSGMYTGKTNKDTVSSFLHGYEIGRNQECKFLEKLANSIEQEYQISRNSLGWIGQIEAVARQLKTDWVAVFKKQSLKIIVAEFDPPMFAIFTDSLIKRINGKMYGVANYFDRDWITDWFGIVDLKANWFKKIWTVKELQLIQEIEEALRTYGDIATIETKVETTNKLKNSCAALLRTLDERMGKED